MGQLFGTDGIRGVANKGLDAALAFRVGQAAAIVLAKGKGNHDGKPFFTIGKDTRISSDMLEAALIAGLCSAGASVMPLGVIPTPAVAYITVAADADAGIVISASHNPFEHNGIKIFNSQGFKLPDALEKEIEEQVLSGKPLPEKTHGDIGRVIPDGDRWVDGYVDHIIGCAEGEIGGLRVVIDCANGASYTTAERIFSHFSLDFEIIKDHPNGVNINDKCGSTHTEALRAMVASGGYDLGIAFDGDADRCLVVDELGNEIDGDRMMGICARHMMRSGRLRANTIVATVMSNIGFHRFGSSCGLRILSAAVGDKNVLEMMLSGGYNLGGEQSGHLIFLDDSTTGDGQLAAVKFLSSVVASGKKVSELAAEIPQFPQVLLNVPVEGGNAVKNRIMNSEELSCAIRDAEQSLNGEGRILVRPSGTEALIRVMVEAFDMKLAKETAEKLVSLLNLFIKNVNC